MNGHEFMQIELRERDPATRRWVTHLDVAASLEAPHRHGTLTLNEASEIELSLRSPQLDFSARVLVGDVVVASTREQDRTEFVLSVTEDAFGERFQCRGRLLRDWVGLAEFQLQVLRLAGWQPILEVMPLQIAAGKIAQEEFEALCEDVASHSAAALLDVYGKTFFGLELEFRPGEHAPIAALHRVRQAIDQMGVAPRDRLPARLPVAQDAEYASARHRGAGGFRPNPSKKPASTRRSRSVTGGGIAFREHVREVADPHFNLHENRILSGFLRFLEVQLADLRGRLFSEIEVREERRAFYHRPGGEGEKSWWEAEDLPRILECASVREPARHAG